MIKVDEELSKRQDGADVRVACNEQIRIRGEQLELARKTGCRRFHGDRDVATGPEELATEHRRGRHLGCRCQKGHGEHAGSYKGDFCSMGRIADILTLRARVTIA